MTIASDQDIARVTELLGRRPQGDFDVVVRTQDGDPVVVRNAPLLHDGTPMPTRYWLVGTQAHLVVSRLESAGYINLAESQVDPDELAQTHAMYAKERDSQIPADYLGPRPHGGVAGTRIGVKCLHAHYANWLAGGHDVVGAWVAERLSQ